MFLGKISLTLDIENRLSLPPSFREQLAGGFFILQGFDRNVNVLTADAFQKIYQHVKQLNIADPLSRSLLRMMLGSAIQGSADSSGRLTIPTELKVFAELGESVLVVGQGDYFEIWSADGWKEQEQQLSNAGSNASRFAMLQVVIG